MMVMIMMTMRMMTASDIAIVLLRMASWSIREPVKNVLADFVR